MRSIQKLTTYLFFVSVISTFLLWFCKATLFTPVHICLLNHNIFSIFKGNREFTVNLLLGISTSAWFATLGFYIDYREKKRLHQEELLKTYVTIKNKCFSRILYEKNSYDNDYNEVAYINNYLNEKKSIFLDYRPLVLVIKVKIYRLMGKIKKTNKEKAKSKYVLLSNDVSLFEYVKEDKYALICSILGDLYSYFTVINMYQIAIKDCFRLIKLYEEKMKNIAKTDFEYDTYNTKLTFQKQTLLKLKKRLLSRYPYNTTEYQTFVNKRDLLAKFYAIDTKFPNTAISTYVFEILESENTIIEDDNTLYTPNDERLIIN